MTFLFVLYKFPETEEEGEGEGEGEGGGTESKLLQRRRTEYPLNIYENLSGDRVLEWKRGMLKLRREEELLEKKSVRKFVASMNSVEEELNKKAGEDGGVDIPLEEKEKGKESEGKKKLMAKGV